MKMEQQDEEHLPYLQKNTSASTVTLIDACCQTDFVKIEVDLSELKKCMVSSRLNSQEPEVLTSESIAETAEATLNKSGMVYDKTTGTWFDYNSNLYYYPNTRLYYNYQNGCYYKYNQKTNQYTFHYQLEIFKTKSKPAEDSFEQLDRKLKLLNLRKIKFFKSSNFKFALEAQKLLNHDKELKLIDQNLTDFNHVDCQIQKMLQKRCGKNLSLHVVESNEHIDEVLSDSEVDYGDRRSQNYLLCKSCYSLIRKYCTNCDVGKNHQLGKNTQTYSPEKYSLQDSHSSDSELDTLTTSKGKYIHCKKCRMLASSSCCKRSISWTDEVRYKRKLHSETNKDAMKRRCIEQGQFNQAMSGTVVKEQVQYSLNQDQSDSSCIADVESETNVVPCIRMMTTSSQSIEDGTLFLITCTGATIGSSNNCDIQIQDDKVSAEHASIFYNQQQRNYFVTDLGSEYGTTLNSTTEHNAGSQTVLATPVTHKSILLIGNSIFVLHLHLGYETCDDCEPGQIQALLPKNSCNSIQIHSKEEREVTRRLELKNMKKKYGLHKEAYKQQSKSLVGSMYADRAAERRQTKGSDNPYEKDEIPSSFETELAEHNKGRKMLQKMGWNKGEGLGKSQTGITEPIVPQGSGKGKYGLGFGNIQRR